MHIPNEFFGRKKISIEKVFKRKNTARCPVQIVVRDDAGTHYLILFAENQVQQFYIERSINYQKRFADILLGLNSEVCVNLPLFFKLLYDGYYAIYEYFPNTKNVDNNRATNFLKNYYETVHDEVAVNNETINSIEEEFLLSWPKQFHPSLRDLQEFKYFHSLLIEEKHLKLGFQHGDFTHNNLKLFSNRIYVMDFEFSSVKQPIGFDLFDYNSSIGYDSTDIPYYKINKAKQNLQNAINKFLDDYFAVKLTIKNRKINGTSFATNLIYNSPIAMGKEGLEINIVYGDDAFTIKYYIFEKTAVLCTWLLNIPCAAIEMAVKEIFSRHSDILMIEITYSNVNVFNRLNLDNHWVIHIPNKVDEFWSCVSKKARYNIKANLKHLNELYENVYFSHTIASECDENVVRQYFEWKKLSHGCEYGLSSIDYLHTYHVTDVITLHIKDKMIAILFYNRNKNAVYLENLSYDVKFSKYSPGILIYSYFLEKLVGSDVEFVFLGNGTQPYKKRFDSREHIVFSGKIYRNSILGLGIKTICKLRSLVRELVYPK